MMIRRLTSTAIAGLLLLFVAASCGGGGGSSNPVTVTGISTGAGTISAGSVVPLSATTSGGNGQAMLKNWSVTAGSLMINPPEFSLTLRETAKAASQLAVSTTGSTVYWVVPETAGSATVSVEVEGSTKSVNVNYGASPVTMAVSSGQNGQKIVTVSASNITDLFGAAFRVSFSDNYTATSAVAGDFLGTSSNVLFLGLTNQTKFVPIAITRKKGASGKDGSGTLATITFTPKSGSSARNASQAADGFDLSSLFFIDSTYARILLDQ